MLSAFGASAALPLRASFADSAAAKSGVIDTHHHIYPPQYVSQIQERLRKEAPGIPLSFYQNWTPSRAVAEMDKAGVASAVISITTPGVWFDDGGEARTRAREVNEFGAQMGRDFPGRFGMFAAIPLPDTDGSLQEIAYSLDVLKLDGIGLLTSYAGKLLGDPSFRPVLEEMNRRNAVVFVHPTVPCSCNQFPGLPNPWFFEGITDTARTITSLLFSGTFSALPNIRFLFSHGGGVLPSIVERLPEAAREMAPAVRTERMPNGIDYELRRQHYDLASIARNPAAIAAVLKLFPVSQLTFGSDAPFHMPAEVLESLKQHGLSAEALRVIQRENALRLLPRFAG
jgi:predicted TIM-barrel fold metal-dependent hydrolase